MNSNKIKKYNKGIGLASQLFKLRQQGQSFRQIGMGFDGIYHSQ